MTSDSRETGDSGMDGGLVMIKMRERPGKSRKLLVEKTGRAEEEVETEADVNESHGIESEIRERRI